MIDLTLYGPDLAYRTALGSYSECDITLRHNATSDATVKLPISSPKSRHLIARGARLVATLGYEDGWSTTLFTGRLIEAKGHGPSVSGEWEAKFEGDFSLAHSIRGYPVPEAPLSDQSAASECTITGPLESVVKEFFRRNGGRFASPAILIAPDKRRGPVVTVSMRMHTLAEKLIPELEKANMGLWVEQTPSGLLVDVYQTATYPYSLSELGGTITGYELTVTSPDVTTIIGGAGESSNTFLQLNPTYQQEVAWGRRIEGYVNSGATEAELREAAAQAFEDGKPTWGVSVDLTANKAMRIGRNIWLGDLVSVELAGESPVVQPLRELVISSDQGISDGGQGQWSIKPVVGDVANGSTRMYQTITRLAQKINRKA